jgi:hypothetical protein
MSLMPQPARPKIYHIVHVDRLASIVNDGNLWSDAVLVAERRGGTVIGMHDIKERRLNELHLTSHPDLYVGQCVPFYFCPRSVMLFLIHCANADGLTYRGGQEPIVHLECDLYDAVDWAEKHDRRWAFTLSNAGARYFEDRSDLAQLHEINWTAVAATQWQHLKEGKQAEFLAERSFPWSLVSRIGVQSKGIAQQVADILQGAEHRPMVRIQSDWYY